jgi:molybdate transport system substrate-binding protein
MKTFISSISWPRFSGVAFVCSSLLLAGCAKPTEPPPPRPQGEVRIAAAADLQYAFPDLIAAFAKQKPDITIKPSFGSSGSFFAQLTNHGPFDLFLSADVDYPHKLVAEGFGEPNTEFVYAIGRIVLWVPNDSKLPLTGFADLLSPSIKKVALANPRNAPYGRLAEAALRKQKLYDQLKDKFVLGDNIAQTAQFVESGNADIGILAHSLAKSARMRNRGRSWTIPADAHPRLEQGGVILKWADDMAAAKAFRDFLISDAGKAVLRESGFDLPQGK